MMVHLILMMKTFTLKNMKTITIKKGNHYSSIIPKFLSLFFYHKNKKIINYYNFNDGCDYKLNDIDQEDVNKLFGFTFNTIPFSNVLKSPHHINSYRFGWRYINGGIEILPYEYKNNIRYLNEPIVKLKLKEWYKFELIIHSYSVIYNIYHNDVIIGTYKSELTYKKLFGHYLGIYFGGNLTAPNDIKIKK